MSSLAQDELGHATALYGLLARADRRDADAIAYDREPAEYRHARLLDHGRGDWAMTIARRYLYDTADAVRLAALADGSWRAARGARRQAPARRALPRDACRIVVRAPGPDGGRVARPARRRARRRWRPMRPRSSRRSPVSRHSSTPACWPGRWPRSRSSGATSSDRSSTVSGWRCPRPRVDPARGRTDHGAPSTGCTASSRWFAAATRERPGDRRRADRTGGGGRPGGARRDPGPGAAGPLDRRPRDRPRRAGGRRRHRGRDPPDVRGLPGARCDPGHDRGAARAPVRPPGPGAHDVRGPVDVRSDLARRARRVLGAGIAPPGTPEDTRCPFCASANVVMDSAFGPTQCRTLFYCRACRQPFEAMKSV